MEMIQALDGTLYGVVQSEGGISYEDIAKAIRDYFENNSIIAPTVNVVQINNGYQIVVSDADGDKTFDLLIGNEDEILEAIDVVRNQIPTKLSELSGDSTHRTVSDAEKQAWSNAITDADFQVITTSDEETGKSTTGFKVGVFRIENPSVAWVQAIDNRQRLQEQNGATKKYVESKIAELIGSAPDTLDTLQELADALGQDKNFSTTMLNKLNNKVDKVFGKGLSTNDLTNSLLNKINDSASREWVSVQGYAKKTDLDAYAKTSELHAVSKTGDYNDLINAPNPSLYATIEYVDEKVATEKTDDEYLDMLYESGMIEPTTDENGKIYIDKDGVIYGL